MSKNLGGIEFSDETIEFAGLVDELGELVGFDMKSRESIILGRLGLLFAKSQVDIQTLRQEIKALKQKERR